MIVAVFSSAFLIISHIVLRPDVATADDYFRAAMFLIIGFIVAALSEHIAKDQDLLRAANQQLTASQQQLKASNQQLQANEQRLRAANQQLKATEQQLRAANQQLEASNQQLRASEEELRKVNHELEECVKELHCLYGLSQLVERPGTTVEEIFQALAELMPGAWEYSEITAARIILENRRFQTANFRKTPWLQSADIKVHGRKAGTIEVCYLQERPPMDEGPFLREERELLDLLAERLGHTVERIRAEEELKAAHQQLLAGEQQLKASNQQLQANEQQLRAANQQLEADFVERKKVELALRESEQLFKVMVETAFDGINICEYDPDTRKRRLVFCNDRYVEMSGYTRKQLAKAENLNELVIRQGSTEEKARDYDCIVNEISFTGLSSWKRPDGKENIYEWSAVSIKKGDKFHIIGVDRDITERKKAEARLRDYRRRLRELASELVLAEEHLRRRIARDLHDDVGQELLS
ncbi:MAG: PAS domain S-box protein, partial [Phycisphaerae bacterium]|nr:PAS domain S-box protein [Phycisphaerae bacterium]